MPETSNYHSSREGSPQLIADAASRLASAGVENARLDAETMLAAAGDSSRASIICGLVRIDGPARSRYAAMVARRMRREPLAYILGHKEFYSLDFEVSPAVLIPRPETETLVSIALEIIRRHPEARVWDLGTGSGAIALAITANAPAARLTATDVSAEALAVARRNAARLGLAPRVQFHLADCFEPLDDMGRLGRFDLVVSNPPYIREDQVAGLAPEISRYEPRTALAGGHDGLEIYRRLAAPLVDHLAENGTVILEIGADQADAVTAIMSTAGAARINVVADLANLPRVVVAHFQ